MFQVTFIEVESGKRTTVQVDPARYPYHDHGLPGSLLDIAMGHHIHIEHACGGNCACTTCHVIIKKGDDHLSDQTDREEDLLDKAPGLTLHSRLACRAIVESGDVEVEIPAHTVHVVKSGGSHE
ncbi:MAG: 2Fe-2S iron-sulfur cluster binding domain-containing protein [Planctomycetes bacterium]|nr:2Fe-2S iron-sulfur cluster binding domain-containing protein [Planctomycetota bacterium]